VPATGYHWTLDPLDVRILKHTGSLPIPRPTPSPPGATGSTYIRFTALAPGQGRIVLRLQPALPGPPAAVLEFTVTCELPAAD
jgi:hypothetical protein